MFPKKGVTMRRYISNNGTLVTLEDDNSITVIVKYNDYNDGYDYINPEDLSDEDDYVVSDFDDNDDCIEVIKMTLVKYRFTKEQFYAEVGHNRMYIWSDFFRKLGPDLEHYIGQPMIDENTPEWMWDIDSFIEVDDNDLTNIAWGFNYGEITETYIDIVDVFIDLWNLEVYPDPSDSMDKYLYPKE